jgi:hypothetical protein
VDGHRGEGGRRHRFQHGLGDLHAAVSNVRHHDLGGIFGGLGGQACCAGQFHEVGHDLRFALQIQRGDKERGQHRQVGQAAAIFEAGDLFASIAHGAPEFVLREAGALAQVLKRRAKGDRWNRAG